MAERRSRVRKGKGDERTRKTIARISCINSLDSPLRKKTTNSDSFLAHFSFIFSSSVLLLFCRLHASRTDHSIQPALGFGCYNTASEPRLDIARNRSCTPGPETKAQVGIVPDPFLANPGFNYQMLVLYTVRRHKSS